MVENEKKEREDMEEEVLKCLEDVAHRMQAMIKEEKKERESTEEMLLKLLEDTCSRIASESM